MKSKKNLTQESSQDNTGIHMASIQIKPDNFRLILLPLITILLFPFPLGCKKAIEVNAPFTSTNAGNVYQNDGTAAAVLTGIYAKLSLQNTDFTGANNLTNMSIFPALSADELTLYDLNDHSYSFFYSNSQTRFTEGSFWNAIYPIIFTTNSAIEGLNSTESLATALKKQLLGEAKFIRAFCYFYLVNLYGDVPLVLNTDYRTNAHLYRMSKTLIYQQIITDLKEAQSLLSEHYLKSDAISAYAFGSEERVRPTKWAAAALLSRSYLYTNDYKNAAVTATNVINHTSNYNLVSLNNVFLKNSQEAIWQLQPVNTGTLANTGDGALFVLPPTGPRSGDYPIFLSNHIVNSFENGDERKKNWVSSVEVGGKVYHYPYKYKLGQTPSPTTEYIMVLRLAEQYLIRSEAKAALGDDRGARSDLNSIRNRAGLPNTTAVTSSDLVNAIQNERKVELFTEWGDRWLNLKRTNRIDKIMEALTRQKGGTWTSYKALYPIPQDEIRRNSNLTQNPGY